MPHASPKGLGAPLPGKDREPDSTLRGFRVPRIRRSGPSVVCSTQIAGPAAFGFTVFPPHLHGEIERPQDMLGRIQDTVVAEQRMRWIARSRLASGAALAAGTLLWVEREARSSAREEWPAV